MVNVKWDGGMRFTATTEEGDSLTMDTDAESGGEGHGFRPVKLVLVGLGGCTGMDIVWILKRQRQEVTGLEMNRYRNKEREGSTILRGCADRVCCTWTEPERVSGEESDRAFRTEILLSKRNLPSGSQSDDKLPYRTGSLVTGKTVQGIVCGSTEALSVSAGAQA